MGKIVSLQYLGKYPYSQGEELSLNCENLETSSQDLFIVTLLSLKQNNVSNL